MQRPFVVVAGAYSWQPKVVAAVPTFVAADKSRRGSFEAIDGKQDLQCPAGTSAVAAEQNECPQMVVVEYSSANVPLSCRHFPPELLAGSGAAARFRGCGLEKYYSI